MTIILRHDDEGLLNLLLAGWEPVSYKYCGDTLYVTIRWENKP